MPSTYLTRTVSSASNRRTWTWSAWIKRSSAEGNQSILTSRSDNANYATIRLEGGKLHIFDLVSSSFNYQIKTNRLLRDFNAWYHIVVAFDTTQSTASNRVKFYINGEQETSLAESSYPAQNYEGFINRNRDHYIGQGGNLGDKFDGSMSHIHLIDGTAYDASDFGQYDANGVWTIKTSPSVTYGTNGFFILKDGNSVTDQSGNSNNFTVGGGTLTNTEDNPSNVFATCNALSKGSDWVFSKGNTNIRNDTNVQNNALGTIALHNGKYYWEVYRHGGGDVGFGITKAFVDGTNHTQVNDNRVLYYQDGNIYREGLGSNSPVNTGVTYGDTDTLAVAVDSINGVITFYKNGTQSGSITDTQLIYSNELWIPWFLGRSGSEMRINFGNGYFGTTAVSSAGTNASGNGIFEYDVPTGYTALSTKGLNE